MRVGTSGLLRPSGPVLPAYEDVYINTLSSIGGGTVTGAAQSTAGAISVLRAIDDAQYIEASFDINEGVSVDLIGVAFDDLQLHEGRDVASIAIGGRAQAHTSSTPILDGGFTGITVTPGNRSANGTGSIANFLLATHTKSGGGNWTVAQANLAACQVTVLGGLPTTARLYNLFARFTYA